MSDPLILSIPPVRRKNRCRQVALLLALLPVALCALAYWLLTGRVETRQGVLQGEWIRITAPMTTQVLEVLVRQDQEVRQGQPLVRLEVTGYRKQEAEARALLSGLVRAHSMEDAASRVAAAKAAEEYIVRRVALARHEEAARHKTMEQRVMEHVQAELRMRDLDTAQSASASAQTRTTARNAELHARQRKETAKDAFEAASRTRAAVEGELQRLRYELDVARSQRGLSSDPPRQGQGSTVPPMSDPTVITAPRDGRIASPPPDVGQILALGETALLLAPADGSGVWATAFVTPDQAAAIHPGQYAVLRPEGLPQVVLRGEVQNILAPQIAPAPSTATASPPLTPLRFRLLDTPEDALAAQLPGRTVHIEIWTRTIPGLREISGIAYHLKVNMASAF